MNSRTHKLTTVAAGLLALGIATAPTAIAAPAPTATAAPSAAAASLPSYETWQSDVRKVMDPSVPYLTQRVKQGGSKLAIVLDIDNTSLETEYHPGAPNKPVLEFAKAAAANGVSVLIATARKESGKSGALSDLKKAGYPTITAICLKKNESHSVDVKIRCRKEFVASGYTLIANVGNRPGDLEYVNYERGFKLPDYDEQLS
ncbi:HAD family acid phosphatase [Streptomyces sp. AM 4-1-1]|uniref:HAD family acid phosphatase n=1 Tax=Streptomyces sp. AM 4-1-1 TaxID=3028710 RepID=UPI0023B9BF77|nr:HAD family acid phosphatase [Streptomyces sp. AM 4-1-1]WEH33596.1 HAD family acid phosphatase [Streptomyces sp. AM 4-1-1]